MKNKLLKFSLVLCLFSVSILRGQTAATKATETPATNEVKAAPIIPVMTFDKKFHDFGNIKTGDSPSLVFTFTNTGNAPLDIAQITGCDCTEYDWTRTTVGVGEKGFVSIKYHSSKEEPEEHKKKLDKYADIILKQVHPINGYALGESLKFNVFIVD